MPARTWLPLTVLPPVAGYLHVSFWIIRLWPCHKDLRDVAIGGFFSYSGRMKTIIDLFRNLWSALGCIVELLG